MIHEDHAFVALKSPRNNTTGAGGLELELELELEVELDASDRCPTHSSLTSTPSRSPPPSPPVTTTTASLRLSSPLRPRIRPPPPTNTNSTLDDGCRSPVKSRSRSASRPVACSPSRTHCAVSPPTRLIHDNDHKKSTRRRSKRHPHDVHEPNPHQELPQEVRLQMHLEPSTTGSSTVHRTNVRAKQLGNDESTRSRDAGRKSSQVPARGAPASSWSCVRWQRFCTWLPGLSKHHNSFVADQMLRVATRTIVVFVFLWISNELWTRNDTCLRGSVVNIQYWIPVNTILALPALKYRHCQLFQHDRKDETQFTLKKTWLLKVCECFVLLEIPGLVVTLVHFCVVLDDAFHAAKDQMKCAWHHGTGLVLLAASTELLCVYAYLLRWWQLVVFHRLHEHLLFQRGYLHGKNRFCFDGQGFVDKLTTRWTRRSRRRQDLQVLMYKAAKAGDLQQLEQAVEAAKDLDGQSFACKWYGATCDFRKVGHRLRVYGLCRRNPLHVAIVFAHLDCVRFLVEQAQFDVNGYDKLELFSMDVSSFYRRVASLCFSLWFTKYASGSTGQNRSVFGSVGTLLTPLHVAVSLGHHDIAELLIQHGANGDALAWSRHQRFCTPPLFWAVSDECVDVLVLQANANHLYVPGNGYFVTAFEAARVSGNYGVSNQLQIYGGDLALTPLHDVAGKGDIKEVEFFLQRGADPDSLGENCEGVFHRAPLHWAAMRGHRQVVKLLVNYGATVDLCDRQERTPLAWACYYGRLDCVEELLEAGADPNRRDADGFPILAICAASPVMTSMQNHEDAMVTSQQPLAPATASSRLDSTRTSGSSMQSFEKLLVMWKQHEGDLAITCEKTGDSALHIALMNDHEAAAIAFVRHGMNLTMANFAGKRAIDFTKSTSIRYAVKKEAGYRDVMVSYCHQHASFAWKIRNALENAHITTWIDQMDPTGITGGAIWRQEIAQAIENSTMMLCILCEHYPESQWCMKELAYAKVTETPVLAIQCSPVEMNEEMQMYLYTRQIIDFKEAIILSSPNGADASDTASGQQNNLLAYNESIFDQQMKLLLDGVHAELQAQQTIDVSVNESHRRRRLRHLATLRGERSVMEQQVSPISSSTTTTTTTTAIDTKHMERSMVRVLTSFDLMNMQRLADKSKEEKLQVYISHGGLHDTFCQRLRKSLLTSRCNVSVAVDMGAGTRSPTSSMALGNKTRLVKSDVVIVVLSSRTIQSCVVADQLAFAEDRFKMIVPVMLSMFEVDAAKRYTFSRQSNKILHFNESLGFDESVGALVKSLQRLTERKRHEILQQQDLEQDQTQTVELDDLELSDVDEYVEDYESDTSSVGWIPSKSRSSAQGHHQVPTQQ